MRNHKNEYWLAEDIKRAEGFERAIKWLVIFLGVVVVALALKVFEIL